MDERDFEARLSRRLHARFDAGRTPDALRERVAASLDSQSGRTGRMSARRVALVALRRQLVAVAAVVAIVILVTVALLGRLGPSSVGTSPLPTGSAAASATPSATASPPATPAPSATPSPSQPSGTIPPISTTAWTGLDVTSIQAVPQFSTIIPWAGGYVAIGTVDSSGADSGWVSRDGRTWVELLDGTLGLTPGSQGIVDGGAACRSGVIIAAEDPSGTGSLWASTDGAAWTQAPIPGGGTFTGIAGGASGAIAATSGGRAIEVTSDCTSWQRMALAGPATTQVTSVAAFGGGYVAVGFSGGSTTYRPLAWWSSDGRSWSAATVQAKPGDGLSHVLAGATGLIAFSRQPEDVPGTTSFWTSTNGHSWVISGADPFGRIASGEGTGSAAGEFAGDGNRLLGYATTGERVGPTQYWVSSDGSHWTQLGLTGSAPTSHAGYFAAFLMRDGVLFSTDAGNSFGVPTGN